MALVAYSPALVLLFVWALLWILMDLHVRDLTRAQRWIMPVSIVVLAVLNHLLRLQLGSAVYGKTIAFTMHLPIFFLFLYLSKCGVIKMAFMILSALIFSALTVMVSDLVRFFFSTSRTALLVSNLCAYAVVLLLVQFVFRRGVSYLLKYGDNRMFLLFSLVPILYYIYVFAIMNVPHASPATISELLVLYLPTMQVFVFYFLLLYVYKNLSERKSLEAAQSALSQELDAAAEQVALLNHAQAQSAVYQHDMRHHLSILNSFLLAGQAQQAEEYIHKVQHDLETITPRHYCENELVNLLCSSFSNKAEQLHVQLLCEVRLPKTLGISDTELCSLLSNGLENALRAAAELAEDNRRVQLYCGLRLGKLLIEIKNPYAGAVKMQGGVPVSNRTGHGYGCRSMQTIAERRGGLCAFKVENGVFQLQLILPMKMGAEAPSPYA